MSEGPEVKHTADKIAEAILGKSVVDVQGKAIEHHLREKIIGSKVLSVDTYGKNIIIHFSGGVFSAQSYDDVGKMANLQTV
jgi:formamidopyrimidine-DNA glycosylase